MKMHVEILNKKVYERDESKSKIGRIKQ